MLDATLRMVSGELPHVDFMTPIGILGFAPVAGFLTLGFAVGKATLLADAAMLAVMLPVIWWLSATRFSKGQAYYFGTIMVITMMAVVYGGGSSTISLSMYYNRWGWSITFLLLATILFVPHRKLGEAWVAPLVIGLSMAALAMLKMTFFVPLLPVVIIILLAQKQGMLLLKAMGVGLLVGVALLAWLGLDFFFAYFEDLLVLTRPESARVNTGVGLSDVAGSPNTIVSSIILFAALIIFRKSARMHQGLVVLVLAPAFTYITYQNWGNDPKWLHLIVLYIWANLPDAAAKPVFGLPARQGGLVLIVAAITFIFPSVFSMATTPFRVLVTSEDEAFAKLELQGGISDIWLPERRVSDIYGEQAIAGWPNLRADLDPLVINGYTFPACRLGEPLMTQFSAMAQQMEGLEAVRGQPVLVADVLSMVWLLGDVGRVPGAAPWYYGDDAGLEGAAFLAVPFCSGKLDLRSAMVEQAAAHGYGLEEIYRSELMVLYRLIKPAE